MKDANYQAVAFEDQIHVAYETKLPGSAFDIWWFPAHNCADSLAVESTRAVDCGACVQWAQDQIETLHALMRGD